MTQKLDLGVDPKAEYQRKLFDADRAAALVRSGDLIWMPSSHQPPVILAALAAREDELEDVAIRSVVIPNMGWFREDARKAWDLQVQYAIAPDNRQALADRLVDAGHDPRSIAAKLERRNEFPSARTIRGHTKDLREKTETS